jgi:hypothetical protein
VAALPLTLLLLMMLLLSSPPSSSSALPGNAKHLQQKRP